MSSGEQLTRTLAEHDGEYVESFVSSPSPGIVAAAMQNSHYPDLESYVGALGAALATEYRTIVDAGHLLQIDAPDLALERHTLFQDPVSTSTLAQTFTPTGSSPAGRRRDRGITVHSSLASR